MKKEERKPDYEVKKEEKSSPLVAVDHQFYPHPSSSILARSKLRISICFMTARANNTPTNIHQQGCIVLLVLPNNNNVYYFPRYWEMNDRSYYLAEWDKIYVDEFNLDDFHSRMKDSPRLSSNEEYLRDYINCSCLELGGGAREVIVYFSEYFKTDYQKIIIVSYMKKILGTHQQDTHIII